jgi:hypothetical protein
MKYEEIVLEIRETDRDVVLVTASGSWGTVMMMGSVRFETGTIYLDAAHIGGGHVGQLGRAGLNAIARKVLEESGADEIVIQGSIRTSGRNPGRAPRAFRFPNSKHPA